MLELNCMTEKKKDNWFLFGDIHCKAGPLKKFYEENKERLSLDECSNKIILLGDVGLNFHTRRPGDDEFRAELSSLPFTYICLRGNHEARISFARADHPDEWTDMEKYGGTITVEKKYPHIEYLSDGPSVYEFNGYKTLSLPGAYSVRRGCRHHDDPSLVIHDELLRPDEMDCGREIIKNNNSFDLVISHTCPLKYEPRDLFRYDIDQTKVDKSVEEFLDEIEENISYKRWAFGHFHAERLYPENDGRRLLLLFQDKVADLGKFMNARADQSFSDITA